MIILALFPLFFLGASGAGDVHSCGGFIKSSVPIDFGKIMVKLHTAEGNLKYETDCAPNNGYYMIPIYSKGSFVISVHPPEGWQFEPESVAIELDGVSDPCSLAKDINFNFAGFGVTGKLKTVGGEKGPAGAKVSLLDVKSKQTSATATTGANGAYVFKSVLPGDYLVQVGKETECVKESGQKVSVKDASVTTVPDFTLAGFPIQGKVEWQGKPAADVAIVLVSSEKKSVEGCKLDSGVVKEAGSVKGNIVCTARSDKDGNFRFPCIPQGEYSILPRKSMENVVIQFEPPLATLKHVSEPATLKETFTVKGFASKGRVVLESDQSKGVGGVEVKVNGVSRGKSDAHGFFPLESLSYGKVKFEGRLPDSEIPSLTVEFSKTNHKVPNLLVTKFNLCGSLQFEKVPESLPKLRQRKIVVSKKGGDTFSIQTDESGAFCHLVSPGTYTLEPAVLPEEREAGLSLVPPSKSLSVVDGPVKNLLFRQFQATISGTIHCLVPCKGLSLSLMRRDSVVASFATTSKQQTHKFQFPGLLPGTYNVVVRGEELCWKQSTLGVKADEADVKNVNFEQTGYRVKLKSTSDATLKWGLVGSAVVQGSQEIKAGEQEFCLPAEGEYELRVESCHRFQKDSFKYRTEEFGVITLTAIAHRIQGVILTNEPANDIQVELAVGENVATLGPLALSRNGSNNFEYEFETYAEPGQALQLTPHSATFLFQPDKMDLKVTDSCFARQDVTLTGQKGEFLVGAINPPLEGVKVTALREGEDGKVTESDKTGKYIIGPLRSKQGFSFHAEKEGYVFVEAAKGNFKASKLSELKIVVESEDGSTLDEVLISLSGGENYRSNNLTNNQGEIKFVGLTPGEYFIRPVLKEYRFDPPSKMVNVEEGSAVLLKLVGTRVAFSVLGRVSFLSGAPVEGAVVEGISEECDQLQEEDATDAEGRFRLRGLQPRCQYRLSVQQGPDITGTIPSNRIIKVVDRNMEEQDFVVKPVLDLMEIAGQVDCAEEVLPSLKVTLVKEDEPDTPIQTIQFVYARNFYFLNIPMDKTKYLVRLESSLSRAQFEDLRAAQESVQADSDFKFIKFKFFPKRRMLEADVSRAGYIMVPLAVLVIALVYNHAKVVPVVMEVFQSTMGSVEAMGKKKVWSEEKRRGSGLGALDGDTEGLDEGGGARRRRQRKT